MKNNRQCANAEVATCTARIVEGHKTGPRMGPRMEPWDGAKSGTTCITSLHVAGEIILADSSLAASALIAKLPNLIPVKFSGYTLYFLLLNIIHEN